MLRSASCFRTPALKQPPVAQREQIAWRKLEFRDPLVDPGIRTFQLRENPDRRFIDHAVAHLIRELGPPLFIHKRGRKPKLPKHGRQCFPVFNRGFGFLPVFVQLCRVVIGEQTLVCQYPAVPIAADPQNGPRCAQAMIRRVEQYVALKGAWSQLLEAQRP